LKQQFHSRIFMRTPIIAGNWKLNKTIAEARSFVSELKPLVADTSNVDVVIVPPFTALSAAAEAAQGTNISIAAQDMYWKDSGAYTGEISAPMLLDAGCKYVVLGHSERRGRFGVPEPDLEGQAGNVFGDSDQSVNKKLHAALQHGLIPIVCVGETLTERQNGHTDAVVQNQTAAALEDFDAATGEYSDLRLRTGVGHRYRRNLRQRRSRPRVRRHSRHDCQRLWPGSR
jgi:triosephosphate isomerase